MEVTEDLIQRRRHRITMEAVFQLDALLEMLIEQEDHDGYDLKVRALAVRARQLNGAVMSLMGDGAAAPDLEECENAVYGLSQAEEGDD